MYYVLHRKSRHGYHVAFGLIKERDPAVLQARCEALQARGEQVRVLRETPDFTVAHDLLLSCRRTESVR